MKVQARAAPWSHVAGEGGQHRHPSNCLLSQKSKQLTVSGCLGIIREGRKLVSSVSVVSLTGGYLLCRLPEVSGVRQPAVQLGQLLQHVGQLGEGGPVPQVVGPAGGQDLLKGGGQPGVSLALRLRLGLWLRPHEHTLDSQTLPCPG